jgi:hypothetical protein
MREGGGGRILLRGVGSTSRAVDGLCWDHPAVNWACEQIVEDVAEKVGAEGKVALLVAAAPGLVAFSTTSFPEARRRIAGHLDRGGMDGMACESLLPSPERMRWAGEDLPRIVARVRERWPRGFVLFVWFAAPDNASGLVFIASNLTEQDSASLLRAWLERDRAMRICPGAMS